MSISIAAQLEIGIRVASAGLPAAGWLVRGCGRAGGDIAGRGIGGGAIGGGPVCRLYARDGGLRRGGPAPEQVPLAALRFLGFSAIC